MTDLFLLSIVVAASVGAAAAYLGSLMITKRMALVGDALGHVALPGMGLALLLNIEPSVGAFVFLAAGILMIWKMRTYTLLSLETVVGIVFVSSLAVGFMIVPEPDLLESLIGDISNLSGTGIVISLSLSVATILIVRRIYRGMMLVNVSAELAAVAGVSETKYELILLTAVALIVSVGVRVTGSLLVGALVIVPPAAARVMSADLGKYIRNSILFGAVGSGGGMVLAKAIGFPAGPTIILCCSLLFLAALAIRATFFNAHPYLK